MALCTRPEGIKQIAKLPGTNLQWIMNATIQIINNDTCFLDCMCEFSEINIWIRVAAAAIALGISYTRDIEDRGFRHQLLLPRNTNKTAELCEHFVRLFKTYWDGQPVRQIHVVCSKLQPAAHEQMDLFMPPELDKRRHVLDETIDQIRDRFGKKAIFHAYSL